MAPHGAPKGNFEGAQGMPKSSKMFPGRHLKDTRFPRWAPGGSQGRFWIDLGLILGSNLLDSRFFFVCRLVEFRLTLAINFLISCAPLGKDLASTGLSSSPWPATPAI